MNLLSQIIPSKTLNYPFIWTYIPTYIRTIQPPELAREDGTRPDGLTLIFFHRGRALVWDAFGERLFDPFPCRCWCVSPGIAVLEAEKTNIRKYLASRYHFSLFAFETLGALARLWPTWSLDSFPRLIRTFKAQPNLKIQLYSYKISEIPNKE